MRQLGSTTTALATLLLGSATVHADAPLIDFEDERFMPGDSVETADPPVHHDLNIHALVGEATIIETGVTLPKFPKTYYIAPNDRDEAFFNCLEDASGERFNINEKTGTAKGFADPKAQQMEMAQQFDFTFAEGVTVNKFSIRMFDYGDFLVEEGEQEVTLKGSTSSNVESTNSLSFDSADVENLNKTGDACGAKDGQPGYVKLEVQLPRMTRVELRVTPPGLDYNVGFDSISFTRDDVEIDIKPGGDPNCFNVNGFGVIPVAILGSGALDVRDVNPDTLSLAGTAVRVKGNDTPQCAVEDVNRDDMEDLVCQFDDDPENWKPGEGEATVTGNLIDRTPFEATDSICITQ